MKEKTKMKKLMMTVVILAAQATLRVLADDHDAQCVIHPPPTNLVATGRESDVIHLQWTPGDNSGVGFDIYHSFDGITFEHINQGYAKGRYNDTYELLPSSTYYFMVRVHSDNPSCKQQQVYSNVATGATTATDN